MKIKLPTNYSLTNHIYIYIYKQDLALNNPQGLRISCRFHLKFLHFIETTSQNIVLWPSQLGCRICQIYLCRRVRSSTSTMSVLDMTLNYLMVRLQSWSFEECGVPFSLPSSFDWSCRIHRLHLCRGVSPPQCPVYDTKQSDGEVPVMLQLWEMQNTSSLPSLPSSLWPEVVAPDQALSMGQIELNCVFMLNWIV